MAGTMKHAPPRTRPGHPARRRLSTARHGGSKRRSPVYSLCIPDVFYRDNALASAFALGVCRGLLFFGDGAVVDVMGQAKSLNWHRPGVDGLLCNE